MKAKRVVLGLALSLGLARAGETIVNTEAPPAPAPTFHMETELRPESKIGPSIEVYGGAIGFQDGTLHLNAGGTELARGDSKNRIGGVAGLRIDCTWPGFENLGDPATAPRQLVMPAMGLDLFWTGFNYKAAGPTIAGPGGSLTADINTISAMYVPMLKFDLGWIRPYVGVGVGATYVNAGNAHVSVGGTGADLGGSSDGFDLSFEGTAGAEFFIDQAWSIDLGYKYLYIMDPSFHGSFAGTDLKYKVNDFGGHLVTLGFHYYY